MPCPLCNGPLDEDEFALHPPDSRLEIALWMAIEALDNEATTLRLACTHEDAGRWADEAADQVRLLRSLSQRQQPR